MPSLDSSSRVGYPRPNLGLFWFEILLFADRCMYIGRVFWALVVQGVVKTIVPHPVYL